MSEEREPVAGAPVEETEASATDVRAAVARAGEVGPANADPLLDAQTDLRDPDGTAETRVASVESQETRIAPQAGGANDPTATRVHVSEETVVETDRVDSPPTRTIVEERATETTVLPEAGRPAIDMSADLPSAGPTLAPSVEANDRDREIRISSDHPMAALYMQTPMPPEVRGNRGAGVLISLLATVAFALVLAGVFALMLAPRMAPSQFVGELTDALLSWSMIFAVVAFFVGLAVLVLIVGRAGWWAYVLGGFLVALLTWAGTVVGGIIDADGFGGLTSLSLDSVVDLAFLPGAIAAFIVAREVTVWFGAWIGARGRRITRANEVAQAEYETALAEARASQS